IRIEVVVGLKNELRPIPNTGDVLVPRPVRELFRDVVQHKLHQRLSERPCKPKLFDTCQELSLTSFLPWQLTNYIVFRVRGTGSCAPKRNSIVSCSTSPKRVSPWLAHAPHSGCC